MLILRTSSWALSRSWTPRALAASRRNCKLICVYLPSLPDVIFHLNLKFPAFSLSSLEELLTTQCDRFTAEEVSSSDLQRDLALVFCQAVTHFFISSSSADEEPLGCLPPWCGWQRWLQEHLLRHHTRRGEGGINPRHLLPLLKPTLVQTLNSSSSPPISSSSSHTLAPGSALSSYEKTCLLYRDVQWEDGRLWGCLCVSTNRGTWDYFQ